VRLGRRKRVNKWISSGGNTAGCVENANEVVPRKRKGISNKYVGVKIHAKGRALGTSGDLKKSAKVRTMKIASTERESIRGFGARSQKGRAVGRKKKTQLLMGRAGRGTVLKSVL